MSDRRTRSQGPPVAAMPAPLRTRKNPPPAASVDPPSAAKKSRPTKSDETPVEAKAPPKKSITDHLICAIMHELPFDPVTAEDGRVYERSAIEAHIKSKRRRELKSPISNEPMGQKLFPAPQIKSLIETLIEHGSIEGDLLDAWKAKEAQKKAAEDLLKKAEGGNAAAMYDVYWSYRDGNDFFKKDVELAFKWLEKAYAAGNVRAMVRKGIAYINGGVLRKNKMEGMVLIARAAEKGSDLAAYKLGSFYGYGKHGLSVDTTEAVFWLRKALSGDCPHRHARDSQREKANSMLLEFTNIPANSSDEGSSSSSDDDSSDDE